MAYVKATDVAKYFLAKVDRESGDAIDHLKLQKLLYYAQGLYLALHSKPLFQERVEAWTHGPVVPLVYRRYKRYASEAIPRPSNYGPNALSKTVREVLDEVWTVFGQFSSWRLREITHGEPPWKNAAKGGEITKQAMRDYFRTRLKQ